MWGGGGMLPPVTNPAAARLRARRSSPRAVLRGSLRPVLGSGASSALRAMHLGQKQGTAGLCSPGMAAAVELADAARAGCACARLWALTGQGDSM